LNPLKSKITPSGEPIAKKFWQGNKSGGSFRSDDGIGCSSNTVDCLLSGTGGCKVSTSNANRDCS
jgi:hypothetical protein